MQKTIQISFETENRVQIAAFLFQSASLYIGDEKTEEISLLQNHIKLFANYSAVCNQIKNEIYRSIYDDRKSIGKYDEEKAKKIVSDNGRIFCCISFGGEANVPFIRYEIVLKPSPQIKKLPALSVLFASENFEKYIESHAVSLCHSLKNAINDIYHTIHELYLANIDEEIVSFASRILSLSRSEMYGVFTYWKEKGRFNKERLYKMTEDRKRIKNEIASK